MLHTNDYNYPGTAGSWVRTNPASGRVGSLFDPAGMQVASVAGDDARQRIQSPDNRPLPTAEAPVQESDRAAPSLGSPPPPSRSVIPRRMGETYLQMQP